MNLRASDGAVREVQIVTADIEDVAFIYPFGVHLLAIVLYAVCAAQILQVVGAVVVDDRSVLSGDIGILDGQI